jgi:hypothetical protein
MPVLDAGETPTRRPYLAVAASVVVLAGIGVLIAIRSSHAPSPISSATTTATVNADSFKADTSWSGAVLSVDGMTLQIRIGTQHEGDGPCEQRFEHKVSETNANVTVAFRQIPSPTDTKEPVVCARTMASQAVEIRLAAPLGDRLLFDGVNPTPQQVWRRADVVRPTVLPAGVTAGDLVVMPGPANWSQSAQVTSGPGWDLWIDQAPAGSITPSTNPPDKAIATATVHGQAATIYEYFNHTGHMIQWTEGGLDITVRAELHTANMSTPQSFANPQVAFVDPLIIRIANGITIPSPTSGPTATANPVVVNGTLALVGGPPGATPIPATGTIKIIFKKSGDVAASVKTKANGTFVATVLASGTYTLIGTTDQYQNGQAPCVLDDVAIPGPDQNHLLVACQMR